MSSAKLLRRIVVPQLNPFADMRVVLAFLILLALCSCSPADDAADPLDQARRLASERKYEEALQKHIWIHDHVLEANPGYYGVRLSFALSDWVELGKKYPKALVALKGIRDQKTARLLGGNGSREIFHDVEAINDRLDESRATADLFKKLEAAQPDFAASVYDIADESLIAAGEYALAKRYLGDPMGRFRKATQGFDRGMEYAASRGDDEATRKAFERIFTDEIIRILTVLDKTGDSGVAREIQARALAILDNSAIRDAIKE